MLKLVKERVLESTLLAVSILFAAVPVVSHVAFQTLVQGIVLSNKSVAVPAYDIVVVAA